MSLAVGTPSSNGQPSDDIETSTAKEIEKDVSDGSRHSSDEHINAEKGELIQVSGYQDQDENENLILSHEEQFPLDPSAQEETAQFTFRAVFVGCCLGGVIAASK
jgi:hypothetical protein